MRTILLVDDDDALRTMVDDWLSAAGFEVIAVPDTVAAVREVEARPTIDLCLIDLVMPTDVPDGPALVRSIRSLRPDMPVILMTGYYAAAARLTDLKAVALLYKPFDMPALIAEITRQTTAA